MKAKKCTLIVNTANGYTMAPVECNSISEAVKQGKEACGFAYRIFDENNHLIKNGFCN